MIDRDKFFGLVRENPFGGSLTQRQTDGLNYLLETWENYHFDKDIRWLAYALATAFHETAAEMQPIEEYGQGQGKEYGQPAGPYNQAYYGRGFVQITWLENYQKAEEVLTNDYRLPTPCVEYPHRLLEAEPSALVLYDGMINSWFTGLGLPDFFNADTEDPVNARKIVNGLDKADLIAGYYWEFKKALA